MNIENLQITSSDLRRLLGAASGDAALLYLYIRGGNDPGRAVEELQMPQTRYSCAVATLRQLGLWMEPKRTPIAPGERPSYSERDVMETMGSDPSFRSVCGEAVDA